MSVHIATSAELGRVVRRGLREPVSFVDDNLLVGPCAVSAEAHVQARCAYWSLQGRRRTSLLKAFQGVVDAIESSQRIVIWTSRRWDDTAMLWALCAWRLLACPAEPAIDLVILGGPAADDTDGADPPTVRVRPADARRRRAEARSLSLTHVRKTARFWRALSSAAPLLADRGNASPAHEPLLALGSYQAAFFPRIDESGPGLSRFDELLFSCVGRDWSTPLDVFVRRGIVGDELRECLRWTGDVFLATRLSQWASHGGGEAALESEPHQVGNVMKAARYRLSDAGLAIQQRGLASLDKGPPLPVWGAIAYDPRAPWVVADGPTGRQRVERMVSTASARARSDDFGI